MATSNYSAAVISLLEDLRLITSEQKSLGQLVSRQQQRFSGSGGSSPEALATTANWTRMVLLGVVDEQVNLRDRLEEMIEKLCCLEQARERDGDSNLPGNRT